MKISSAAFTGTNNDIVVAQTDQGEITIPLPPQKETVVGSQSAFAEWMANGGGHVSGWVAPSQAPDAIAAGERCIEQAGFTACRLVTMLDMVLQAREAGSLSSKPKLVGLYTWMQTVKGMAKAGAIEFPAAPCTFEEVVNE